MQGAKHSDAHRHREHLQHGSAPVSRGRHRSDFSDSVDQGCFAGAIDWRIDQFSDFPTALEAHRAELDGKTTVGYCTGGIRCEKAALLTADAGITNVLRLDGGVLRYFEETGGEHFEGNCFAFEERDALNDTLARARPG